jgi:death-on-curing protein
MISLTAVQVIVIHDDIIEPHELQGLAPERSIEAAIDRIDNRIAYGLIADVYQLAACYAIFIAKALAFNDANKRTAFAALDTVLALNGIELVFDPEAAGEMIIKVVTDHADENDLAAWLRTLPNSLR